MDPDKARDESPLGHPGRVGQAAASDEVLNGSSFIPKSALPTVHTPPSPSDNFCFAFELLGFLPYI